MTLDEHAAELWARDGAHNESTFVYLSPEYQKLWFCKAYDELRAERDQLGQSNARCPNPLGLPNPTPPPAEAWRDKLHIEQLKRERAEARSALNRIHTAFSNGSCGLFDPAAIAEKTVNFINAHKDAPEPPRKAVYEWQDAKDVPIHCYLFRGGACCGKVWPRGDGLCGWEASCTRALSQPIIGTAVTLQLARAAVEAVVRAHFGDEA